MKAGSGKRKGGSFENKMCKALSIWWSEGTRDDLFARTASSGGRFTLRKKTNKGTANQEGDITSTTPEGLLLIQSCCFEMKNGYKGWSIMDLLDKPERKGKSTPQTFELFYQQASETKSKWPIIIAKKDGRKELIFYPMDLHNKIRSVSGLHIPEHLVYRTGKNCIVDVTMIGMNLYAFFGWSHVKGLKHILNKESNRES